MCRRICGVEGRQLPGDMGRIVVVSFVTVIVFCQYIALGIPTWKSPIFNLGYVASSIMLQVIINLAFFNTTPSLLTLYGQGRNDDIDKLSSASESS